MEYITQQRYNRNINEKDVIFKLIREIDKDTLEYKCIKSEYISPKLNEIRKIPKTYIKLEHEIHDPIKHLGMIYETVHKISAEIQLRNKKEKYTQINIFDI